MNALKMVRAVVLVCLLAGSSSSGEAAALQKWEYTFLTAGVSKGEFKARFINGKEVANWGAGPGIHDYLNQLGAEGWELVGFTAAEATIPDGMGTRSSPVNLRFVLKRPKG